MKMSPGDGHGESVKAASADEGRIGLDELYRKHAPFVARFLLRIGVDRDSVEDAMQEVFLVAHRKGGYVAGPAKPTTWLGQIAIRIASTHRRSRSRRRERPEGEMIERAPGTTGNPEVETERRRAMARLAEAMDVLDLDHRAVFVLFELEGLSGDEIAAALGIPLGTVHSRVYNARKKIKKAYDDKPTPTSPPRSKREHT